MSKYELFYCDGNGAASRGMESDTNYIVKFKAENDLEAFIKVYLRLNDDMPDIDELSVDAIKSEFDNTDPGDGSPFIFYLKKGKKVIYEFADYDALQYEDDEICFDEM